MVGDGVGGGGVKVVEGTGVAVSAKAISAVGVSGCEIGGTGSKELHAASAAAAATQTKNFTYFTMLRPDQTYHVTVMAI